VGLAGASGTNDGTGDTARFYLPFGVAADNAGDVFVTDFCNHTIRKVTSAGEVTTLAGLAGVNGTYDGTGSAARFDSPAGVAVDALGNLFVADRRNHTIRKVTSEGVVTTLAGNPGASGTNDGFGSRARFMFPRGVAVDTAGNLFVADTENHRIIKGTILCPMITPVFDGKNLHLSWPARFLGWELQEQPYPLNEASGADWSVVTGSRMTNHMYLPIDPVNPGVFYRLHFP